MSQGKELPTISQRLKRRTLYMPRAETGATIYEAELADQLTHGAIRQVCIYRSEEGYHLKALPTWKDEFLTLISVKHKGVRYYKSLDRLIEAILRFGPLPNTLLIGDAKR